MAEPTITPQSRIRIRCAPTTTGPGPVRGQDRRHGPPHGAVIAGPVLLPTHIKKYTVLRSPHVDKKSREQFEMRIHKRLIELKSPTSRTVDELMKLDLPAAWTSRSNYRTTFWKN